MSEGKDEAACIRGNRKRYLDRIQSEANREIENIRGKADAKSAAISALVYNQKEQSVAFYSFTRSSQAFEQMLGQNMTLVLSIDRELFTFLQHTQVSQAPLESKP